MSLLAHTITAAPPAGALGAGLRGRPLAWAEWNGLGLWSSEWDPADRLGRDDALEHHRLVERICAVQPCLPVRFGTAFASGDAAAASLAPRGDELRAALGRVAGRAELAVTLLWRDEGSPPQDAPLASPPGAGPGRRFLEARRRRQSRDRQRRERAGRLADRLLAELAGERPLVRHEICTANGMAVSLAVLVASDRALQRKAALERVAGSFADVVGVVNGPWPPYSFTEMPADEAGRTSPSTG